MDSVMQLALHAHCAADRIENVRKYWDEDYVRALEAQVHSLLLALEKQSAGSELSPALTLSSRASQSGEPDAAVKEKLDGGNSGAGDSNVKDIYPNVRDGSSHEGNGSSAGKDPSGQDRSQLAMEELCVMLWRTNVGDGVTIIDDPKTGSHYAVETVQQTVPPTYHVTPTEHVLAYCRQQGLVNEMASLFLKNINREHQFTSYTTLDFLQSYPYEPLHEALLHSAIIATGTTFSRRTDAVIIGDAFAEFAESLVFSCCRQNPTVKVIQSLTMMSWRSLALGRDHFSWMYISMAAGMCVYLRLHVLALEECEARRLDASEEDIRTFWMFYIGDRTAITILGRNCALPWRRVNVPNFDTTFESSTADIYQLSFAWQCRLWYLHDQYMDQVFSTSFESLPISQQVRILVASQENLNTFFRSRHDRLHLSGDLTPKPVLQFHLAYQMTILITMPPFLRMFAAISQPSSTSESGKVAGPNSEFILLVLRSLTTAATAVARLVRTYRRGHGFEEPPNPLIVHHLLSASVVHLMNATSQNPALRHQSTYWLRQCLELLRELQTSWPERASKSVMIIRILAQRWGVMRALPTELGYHVDPAAPGSGRDFRKAGYNSNTNGMDTVPQQGMHRR
ncbi:fungal specific transcription factor domain-containing protein [Colletotrichum graminicola M1.001]|uniref:Fungal specific transcription factor domain-containing protein n=1 Tax=Colletotrichum graminicola (strain M1.001 / M2 / FGSC 10212) TaxID=645133 RepID=E3QH35_COLGM|nr:fungal specific transcription factor domain-containing protein [Colletotrichum graminicola M1.001]EFQ30197.1 fungal specific transcription factor domain-containing protein [Colletotrichum graminicola M1.001]